MARLTQSTGRDENPRQIEIAGAEELRRSGLLELTRDLATNARSAATRQAYRSDLASFIEWTEAHDLAALPARPETIAAYVAQLHREGRKPSTIDRALTAISQAHKLKGHPSPTTSTLVRETRAGMRRRAGVAQKKARPITLAHLERMIQALDQEPEPRRSRDRALLAIGWAGALRRAEIAALDWSDFREHAEGLILTLRRSKADQEGAGREIGIPFGVTICPVRLLATWRAVSRAENGPVFVSSRRGGNVTRDRLSARSVDRIIRQAAETAGYSEVYSSHGLRAGFATSAAEKGLPDREIMNHTGHRSARVFQGYVRSASVFLRNPLQELLQSDRVPRDPTD